MKPIDFKGRNIIFGEGQPEYLPLPGMRMPDGEVYTCWEFSDAEIEQIVRNKCLFLKQATFNQPLQPILPMIELGDDIYFTE